MARQRKQGLCIYLLKPEFAKLPLDAPIKKELAPRQFAVSLGDKSQSTLWVRGSFRNPPKWASFFSGATLPTLELTNESSGAVLIVKRAKKAFALTFGMGRHLLKPGCVEDNFGLRVALNSIDPEKIRSIDRVTLDARSRHTRTQVSKLGKVSDLGHDVDQDLLRSITAFAAKADLSERLTGSDALSFSASVALGDLPSLLDRISDTFAEEGYKENFAWIDHIKEVKDKPRIEKLDEKLVEAVRSRSFERLWLAVPDLMDWTKVEGFKYRAAKTADQVEDIHFNTFLDSLDEPEAIDLAGLHRHRVYCVDGDGNQIDDWSVYQCIYCEVDLSANETCLLSNGKWYQVSNDFVKEVNDAVKKIKPSKLSFPPCVGLNEADYNKHVAGSDPKLYHLMDRRLTSHGGGRSKIEFCDLLTTSRQLVHVKHYAGSSVMSHLFAQGGVSASLLISDEKYRKKVYEELPKSHRVFSMKDRPRPDEFEVAYAVISRSKAPLHESLPFFSRLNLKNTVRTLRDGMGFNVSLTKIEWKSK